MAVQLNSLIVSALQRAVAAPAGMALVGSRSAPGLFTATATGKQAAQRCKEDGLLRVVPNEAKGKKPLEVCTLTEKGLRHLLEQTSPRPVLEALVQAIGRCETRLRELVGSVALQHQQLESLRAVAVKLLEPIASPPPKQAIRPEQPDAEIAALLQAWHDSGRLGDCPLPDLYRRLQESAPALTIGAFHDALRSLQARQLVYLHPWTGPLYELSEPALALLTGHEIAYYASWRAAVVAA